MILRVIDRKHPSHSFLFKMSSHCRSAVVGRKFCSAGNDFATSHHEQESRSEVALLSIIDFSSSLLLIEAQKLVWRENPDSHAQFGRKMTLIPCNKAYR
jgi:hypothetical protein